MNNINNKSHKAVKSSSNTQTHTDVFCFTVDKTRGVLVKFLIKISDKKTFPIIFDHVFKRHIDNF